MKELIEWVKFWNSVLRTLFWILWIFQLFWQSYWSVYSCFPTLPCHFIWKGANINFYKVLVLLVAVGFSLWVLRMYCSVIMDWIACQPEFSNPHPYVQWYFKFCMQTYNFIYNDLYFTYSLASIPIALYIWTNLTTVSVTVFQPTSGSFLERGNASGSALLAS